MWMIIPSCEPGQFIAWSCLLSPRKLWIWLQTAREFWYVSDEPASTVRLLVLARLIIREEETIFLLYLLKFRRDPMWE